MDILLYLILTNVNWGNIFISIHVMIIFKVSAVCTSINMSINKIEPFKRIVNPTLIKTLMKPYVMNPFKGPSLPNNFIGPVFRNFPIAKQDDKKEIEKLAQNFPLFSPIIKVGSCPARHIRICACGMLSTKDSGNEFRKFFEQNIFKQSYLDRTV